MNIGPIQLTSPFCQAGLAGYSDRAMRLVARRRGCPYAVTEALLDVVMLAGGLGLRRSIDISDEDHPVAGQLIGSEPHQMTQAALILHQAGYDVIDLNFACPVKKIRSRLRGGHMLADPVRAIDILKTVRDALPPSAITTLSLRRAFDDTPAMADAFDRIVDAAFAHGYAAVRVHGRTVEQKYAGRADWQFLADLKKRYPQRTILGSGDVLTAEDAVRMKEQTGVDVVWIARGAIGNPWIFQHAVALLAGQGIQPPSIHQQRQALHEHFALAMQIHGEQLAGRRMRKMGIKYSRFHPEHRQVWSDFVAVTSLRQWNQVLDHWYSHDGPGIWPPPTAADLVNEPQECPA